MISNQGIMYRSTSPAKGNLPITIIKKLRTFSPLVSKVNITQFLCYSYQNVLKHNVITISFRLVKKQFITNSQTEVLLY